MARRLRGLFQRLGLALALGLTTSVAAVDKLDLHQVEDLDYGRALFEFFQGHQLDAITQLMVARERPRPQSQLDEIYGVAPLGDAELAALVGQSCVAVVYDSDISINDGPIANLQGGRYGLLYFTVLDAIEPGSIPESGSDSSLLDLVIRG